MTDITTALFLSLVAKSIIDGMAEPLRQRYPLMDMWWLIYVAWVVGGLLSFAAQLDLFAGNFPTMPWVGVLLTAVLVGGGSKLINDLFKKNDAPKPTG